MGRLTAVCDILAQGLVEHAVKFVFGYPGAAICPFYNSLSKIKQKISHILVRQEQNACHAASGYARVTGKVGVCVATSGPGALNLIPAIAAAYMDSIPLVIITGQVSSELLGRDVFQEADITGAVEPFVKHSYLLRDGNDTKRILDEAFYIASTGRQGPVLIDIPVNVQTKTVDTTSFPFAPPRGYFTDYLTDEQKLLFADKAMNLIKAAKKPLLCVGGGVFGGDAKEELDEFIKGTSLPFVTTMMGLSCASPVVFSGLYLGMIGQYGNQIANEAINQCDLLFLIGARVGDRAISSPDGLSKKKTIIHLDIDPAEINKNIQTDLWATANVKDMLPIMLSKANGCNQATWINPPKARPTKSNSPSELLQLIYDSLSPDAIVACDVGQSLLWAARQYSLENGRFLASGGMGTMGYSLPAAVGAQIAFSKREVAVICGDGAFQMNMMELATISKYKLPIKIIIFDNNTLGLVKELQNSVYSKKDFAVSLDGNPNFKKLFDSYGIPGFSLDINDGYEKKKNIIKEFLNKKSTAALICRVDPESTSLD